MLQKPNGEELTNKTKSDVSDNKLPQQQQKSEKVTKEQDKQSSSSQPISRQTTAKKLPKTTTVQPSRIPKITS